jgi:hypothetical protein
VNEINLSQLFGKTSLAPSDRGAFSDRNLSYIIVGQSRWAVSAVVMIEGECYQSSLFFLNIDDLGKNFCVISQGAPIQEAVLSPDLSKVAYLAHVGGISSYLTVADITPEIRAKLGQ